MVGMAAGRSTVNPSDPEAGFQRLELEFLCRWRGGGGVGLPAEEKETKEKPLPAALTSGDRLQVSPSLRHLPPGQSSASRMSLLQHAILLYCTEIRDQPACCAEQGHGPRCTWYFDSSRC